MASASTGPAGPLIQTLFDAGTAAGLSDRALVERFLGRGDGAESAFAGLVERHGPMVLRVCRDVLRDPHDADDAFQAVFLILARRAGSIRSRESVGPWLYGVALRVARTARKGAGRRREVERKGAEMRAEEEPAEVDRLDAAPAIHDEVGRLPEKYRAAVVLCYFEGLTHEQAAGQLGWPVGTVRSRLAGARDRLRSRLTRRGLAPSAGFLAASAAAEGMSAIVPSALAAATVGIAMRAGEAGAVPASVAALAGRFLRVTAMTKLSMIATGFVAAGLVASAGVGLVGAQQEAGRERPRPERPEQEPDRAPSPMSPPCRRPTAEDRPVGGFPGATLSAPPVLASADSAPRPLGPLQGGARRVSQTNVDSPRTAMVSSSEMFAAKGEVEALGAQLEASREDLQDQIEMLKAQLAIREADVATAKAQLEKANDGPSRTPRRWPSGT